ncbi:MAG: outer membrane beta-barrel protein [Bdellovibrionales bacterium]
MFKIILIVVPLLVSSAFAQNKVGNQLEVSTEVDLYYSFNLLKPQPVASPGAGQGMPSANNQYHIFDAYHDSFSLALAEVNLYKKVGRVEAVVDLGFGQNTDLLSPNDEVSKNILQAYLTYNPKEFSSWSISAGKMYTHIGFEVIRSRDNWNYTRSILFGYAGPYWHTGAAVRYAPDDKFSAGFFLYNENAGLYETGRGKSVGMQLQGSLSEQLSLTYNFLSGSELDSIGEKHTRTFHELIADYKVSPALEVATDVIYGRLSHIDDDTADWLAWEVLAKWSLGSSFYISPRYEIFYDKNGVTIELASTTKPSLPQKIQSFTLTSGWKISEGLEARIEARQDRSSENIFVDGDSQTHKSQTTVTLGLMYSF